MTRDRMFRGVVGTLLVIVLTPTTALWWHRAGAPDWFLAIYFLSAVAAICWCWHR